ncbi:hypothetical protein [Senegalia sp. (in: firmicutes)]|uniref:hypothetical protein n=2 Tax=Bacillota TaxID=1239 RepID=UPI003F950F8F
MAKAFARQTKLGNVVGRSEYITDPKRQEDIVFHSKKHLHHSWEDYADFEKENQKSKDKNNEGREIIIALPHKLESDLPKLEKIIDEYSFKLLGKKRDFEYAVHWNEKKTNLHAHIIYSERERVTEREPKRYKRDMWFNIENNRMAKANSEGAELRYKKDEIMKDKEGNVRYDSNPFTSKDIKFKNRSFNDEIKKVLKDVLNKHGFNYRLFNPKKEIAQIHVGHKKSRKAETYKNLKDYNQEMSTLNFYLSKNKTSLIFYKAVFKDLRFDNKEDWELAIFEKTKEIKDLELYIKNKIRSVDKNEKRIQTFYKKVDKKEEIDKELDKVTNQSYTKWNFFKAPIDFVIRKMMEKDLEKIDIEEEYQDYIMSAKVYSDENPTPMHKNIAKLKKDIQKVKRKKASLTKELKEMKQYGGNYEVLIRTRESEKRNQKEREKEIAVEKKQAEKLSFNIKDMQRKKVKTLENKKKKKRGFKR